MFTTADALADALRVFADRLPDLVTTVDAAAADLVGAEAQRLVPFDTGELSNSAVFGAGVISYASPHAVAVFGGTLYMAARPWVIDAAAQVETERLELYEAAISAAWEQL